MDRVQVRAVLGGEVQDTPFLERLGRQLQGRNATIRRVGPALELRIESQAKGGGRALEKSVARMVRQSAAASRCEVSVVSLAVVDGPPLERGIHLLAPAPGVPDPLVAPPRPGRDLAPCKACIKEFSAAGRRHSYARVECLHCGPRYSHASSLPLTRSSYGLGAMSPCNACNSEMHDARSRRFAFERVSCAECGPTLTWLPSAGTPIVRGAVEKAVERLRAGGVVAVQAPYGALALCRADNIPALRLEIGDEFVPLALLVSTVAGARKALRLSATETRALESAQAPELSAAPSAGGLPLARELVVFGSTVRLRLPDSPVLQSLAARAGPLALAAASRGGAFLPQAPGGQPGVPNASWISDGPAGGDPVPPMRAYFLGTHRVLLSHGRGSLPASARAWHDKTVLAFSGDTELYGAASFGGIAYLTGSAGPSTRSQAADRLRRLVSRAAALSPAASADRIDAVLTGPGEGTPLRMAAEETAEAAGCPVVEVSPALARAMAALPAEGRAPTVVVLGHHELAGRRDKWLGAAGTGGDAINPATREILGGLAPYELVESAGGRGDLVGPLSSLFERAGAPVLRNPKEDAPLLDVLRKRSQLGTSFGLLVDGVAAALGLVPRRAPAGSGLAEIAGAVLDHGHSHRFRFHPRLVVARGCKHLDTAALLGEWADHWQHASRREGKDLPWERRLALGASFLHGLLQGVAMSVAKNRRGRSPVLLTGTAFATPPVAKATLERFQAAGLDASLPVEVPILDGALPIGQVRAFGRQRPRSAKSR